MPPSSPPSPGPLPPSTPPLSPLLTIVVPAYGAEDYLHRALDPLLTSRGGVEVVIVDDGSQDGTGAIADAYAATRPDLFRVVHQLNKGHGGAINTGIDHARGRYLKVLDADDWLAAPALAEVVRLLGELEQDGGVDALLTDYVHERQGRSSRSARFDDVFPAGRVFGWEDTAAFGTRQYLMMHAIIYRTEMLRTVGLRLPEHTFYVDNLYVVTPLRAVRRMYYLPRPLYRYAIGREGQSVQADVMLRRIDQQLRVNRLALQMLPSAQDVADGSVPAELHDALLHYVQGVCAVTFATLARGGTPHHLQLREGLWQDVRTQVPELYGRMRRSVVGVGSNLPGHAGRQVTSLAYRVARRVVGFS